MSSYLLSLYKKKINFRLVVGSFFLAISLFVLLFFKSPIYNYVKGPLRITPDVINSYENKETKVYFVSFEAKDLTPLDVQRKNNDVIQTSFYALSVGEKYLLVELPEDYEENAIIEGCFRPFSDKLKESIISVHPEYADTINSNFYGVYVNGTVNPTNKALIAYGLILFFFTFGAAIIVRCIKLMRTPCEITILNKGYDRRDKNELLRSIDSDFASTGFEKIGRAQVSANWIIVENGLSIQLLCLDDIVWAYRLLGSKGSLNSSDGCKLFDRYGESYILKLPLKTADGVLDAINSVAPWITLGYSNQLDDLWMTDKNEFIASVEEAKQKLLN